MKRPIYPLFHCSCLAGEIFCFGGTWSNESSKSVDSIKSVFNGSCYGFADFNLKFLPLVWQVKFIQVSSSSVRGQIFDASDTAVPLGNSEEYATYI